MSRGELSPNVYGIETEYSCTMTLPDNRVHEIVGSCHSVDKKLGLYQKPRTKGTDDIHPLDMEAALADMDIRKNSRGMLSNGGRLYIDPSGPEYATPETTSAQEAVHRTFDGDTILLGMFRRLEEKETIRDFQLNRRIVDHNRSSRGVHLNTVTYLPGNPTPLVTQALSTLNIVKGAIFGSGGLLVNSNGETEFHHSPRLSLTNAISANYGSYSQRPLVRHPFKPDAFELNRVETVTSDALNFGWPLRASLVVTNALIKLLEVGRGNMVPEVYDPIEAARMVGQYGNETVIPVFECEDYSLQQPLDVMRTICEAVLETDHKLGFLDKESDQVIGQVIDVADRMSDDVYAGAGQVESVTRLMTMERKMERHDITLGSETMCRVDYSWDHIGGSGVADQLRNKGHGWQGFDAQSSVRATRKRLITPPQDTRASVRGQQIKAYGMKDSSDWAALHDVGYSGSVGWEIHPLATDSPIK